VRAAQQDALGYSPEAPRAARAPSAAARDAGKNVCEGETSDQLLQYKVTRVRTVYHIAMLPLAEANTFIIMSHNNYPVGIDNTTSTPRALDTAEFDRLAPLLYARGSADTYLQLGWKVARCRQVSHPAYQFPFLLCPSQSALAARGTSTRGRARGTLERVEGRVRYNIDGSRRRMHEVRVGRACDRSLARGAGPSNTRAHCHAESTHVRHWPCR
jgi:hypothetical protein